MEALLPGYLKQLEKHVKAGKMFYFAILPLGEYNNHTTGMKPEATIVLERYLSREEGYIGGSMVFFYFLEHYKELMLNQCGLCRSLFQGYYQLVVAIFSPGTTLPNTTNFASISGYSVEFKIVKALALRCIETILSTIIRLKQPDGSYNCFTVGATLDSDARGDDYEKYLVYLADSQLEPLPNPDPELNFGPVEYGLLEALIIFLCKVHPILATLITNEIGGSDQIKNNSGIDIRFASVYYHVGKNQVPKNDVNFVKNKLASRSKWKKMKVPYEGIEKLSDETLNILFPKLQQSEEAYIAQIEENRRQEEDLEMYKPVFTDGVLDLEKTFPVEKVCRAIGIRLKSAEITKYVCDDPTCLVTFSYLSRKKEHKKNFHH
jgi:hypothetical protein